WWRGRGRGMCGFGRPACLSHVSEMLSERPGPVVGALGPEAQSSALGDQGGASAHRGEGDVEADLASGLHASLDLLCSSVRVFDRRGRSFCVLILVLAGLSTW